ncbi:MAG TPA: hypothetical protein DEZ08_01630 [Dehalococcoidia bacterium]|nr:hypothetical protein [Dehalococcoidia bacterium]
MNISEFLILSSAIVPDRTAISFENRSFTYENLYERVNNISSALKDIGINKGDRIAVMNVNSHHLIEVFFACCQIDAVFVPINFRAKSEELSQMLKISQPKLLFLGNRYADLITKDMLSLNQHVIILDGPETSESVDYLKLVSGSGEQIEFPENDESDTAVIMFTSGTTGTPKGVLLSHDSFSSYILSNISPADPDVEESNLLTVPLYHIAGLQASVAGIFGGRTIVLMKQFSPDLWMSLVNKHGIDRAMLVPTMMKQLIDSPNFNFSNLASLKVITYGASQMPLNVITKALKLFPGVQFINAFGQTETASTITMLSPEDHMILGTPEEIQIKTTRLSSIGKPLNDVEVMIVGSNGQQLPTGEIGEIVARGERMMTGYWKQEQATAQTKINGWIYTGDLAYQDSEGYIFLAGRSKDFIKRGGEMISPEEVEQFLMTNPLVEEAAIVGVPDDEWGEVVKAFIVKSPGSSLTEAEIIDYCGSNLSSFKKPQQVTFLDVMPRNALGKILKTELRMQ